MILPANGTNKEYLMKKDTRQKHLSNDSHHIAVKLFKMILNISYSSELIRNEIQDEKINIREVFNFIDHSKGGIISRDELKNFMSKYEFHLLAGDLENLMNRFDRNQSGKINFKEFEYELLPKFVEN